MKREKRVILKMPKIVSVSVSRRYIEHEGNAATVHTKILE